MAWKGGFSGLSFPRLEFRNWLHNQVKPSWAKLIVIHNTDAPYIRPPIPGSQRIRNLGNYYKNDLGWSSGPHFFVLGTDSVYLGTPVSQTGTGSPSWNGIGIHIECEGKYTKASGHDPKSGLGGVAWDAMAWTTAELLSWLGLSTDAIRFHKEDPRTTHKTCPGELVEKAWFISKVAGAMDRQPSQGQQYAGSTPAARSTLKKGMTGGDVPVLQILLNYHGATPKLLTDGNFGPKTETEVKSFQGRRGLATDGVVGPITWGALGPYPPPAAPVAPTEDIKPDVPPLSSFPDPIPMYSDSWLIPMMKKVEGLRLGAYRDAPGWAIGYGHNSTGKIPPIPYEGMTLKDEKEAETILRVDLNECRRYLLAWVTTPLTVAQVDALCMFTFQQGATQMRNYLIPTINSGDHAKVAELIETKEHANPGVMRRRRLEASRYRGETPFKW